MITIKPVTNDCNELNIIRDLFEEYLKELNENLCFQRFDEELQNPLKKYGSPSGSLLLALCDGEPAGCIALQALSEKGICEMKRLYVRPQFRQFGLGNLLIKAVLEAAKEKGYNKMVLDTLERLQPAIKLYIKHGFENRSAYYKNPLPSVVYMQKVL